MQEKIHSENLTRVLYPSDTTAMGRELRFQQEYFFVSASLQDILVRYLKQHQTLDELPDHVAIQLNDTHPALAIPELMRILLDEHGLDWDRAWAISTRVFSYTNHTLLPEALETWPVSFFESILPRHLQIVYQINHRFLTDVRHRYPGDADLARRVSIIDEADGRRVRMSHLALVGSHAVNGVSALHTDLMRRTLFADFERLFPGRITNITNGITPRRWLNEANPGLAALIASRTSCSWVTDLDCLRGLEPLADDAGFQQEFLAVKRANKERFAELVRKHLGLVIDPASLFDVQIKRIHEYKRQLLNLLGVIARYNRIRADPGADIVPRTVIFAGKAAPSYTLAKLIIKLIHEVADVIDNDPARRRAAQGRLHPELRRQHRLRHHPRGRPLRADLDRGHGGLRHRQHEARPQRRADDRHPGRRDRRDPRGCRRGEHLHLRAHRRRGARAAPRRLRPGRALQRERRAAPGDRHDRQRLLLAPRAGALPADRRFADLLRRPLPRAGRLRELPGSPGPRGRALPPAARVGAARDPQRRADGLLLDRPHGGRIRGEDLGGRTGANRTNAGQRGAGRGRWRGRAPPGRPWFR